MFEKMTSEGKKGISDIIFFTIKHDTINIDMLIKEFNISESSAMACISALTEMGIIQTFDKNHPVINMSYVLPTSISDLHDEVKDLLLTNGHSEADIITAFEGLPLEEKKVTSNILSDTTHEWVSVERVKPEMGKPVKLRLVNPSKIYAKSRTEIIHVEDIKIGVWDGKHWVIAGPHPKYDFSPLSDKDDLKEGTEVTHWAEADEKSIQGWATRLDPIGKYEHLEIKVDKKCERALYSAFILAAACISKEFHNQEEGSEMRAKLGEAYRIMNDLQSSIDYGIIQNSEEGKDDAVDNGQEQ